MEEDVRIVIESQLDAFAKKDFETAYSFAHSGIKAQFTQADFELMVRGSFGVMLDPARKVFEKINRSETGAEAEVVLTDKNGTRTGYRYLLEMDGGKWRISGVIPFKPVDALV